MDLGCESELDGTEMAETNNNNAEENGGRWFNFNIRGHILGKEKILFSSDFCGVISKQYKYFILSGTILSDSLSFLALWRNQEQ